MANLPALSGKEVIKRLESLGWVVARQSGSHIILIKEGEIATLSVPIIAKSQRALCAVLSEARM